MPEVAGSEPNLGCWFFLWSVSKTKVGISHGGAASEPLLTIQPACKYTISTDRERAPISSNIYRVYIWPEVHTVDRVDIFAEPQARQI